MSGGEFSLDLRVYIEDTDAGGIVYYVNYLKFMERARTELMRSLGFGKKYIFNHDLMFVVRDVKVQYLRPATLDDELVATAAILDLRGASMVMHQRVQRGVTGAGPGRGDHRLRRQVGTQAAADAGGYGRQAAPGAGTTIDTSKGSSSWKSN